MCQIPEFM